MPERLVWDADGARMYETGVDRGVLYKRTDEGAYGAGVAWNGLTNFTESPSGAEATAVYADNRKYVNMYSVEEFSGTLEAITYPDEFEECDGSAEIATGVTIGQQKRKGFGFCYRTLIGNDLNPKAGYKIHLVYGCMAAPSEKAHNTVNESPENETFSWEISTVPVDIPGFDPTASVVIDSTKVTPEQLTAIENVLYGSSSAAAKLLMPDEIAEMLKPAD